MASTSINIQPCLIGSSETHNYRLKPLDYVRSDLSNQNESWQSDNLTLSQHLDAVRTLVKARTGRSLQAKATPLREGVIVIQESTTMAHLQRFAEECERKWGIKALQIHIHKDEGHMRSKEFKPNLHAHMVFRWVVEETGKSPRLGRNQMMEMQTLLAECLEMERGVASDKKHLSSLQFKVEAEQKRLEELSEGIGDARNVRKKIEEAVKSEIKPIEAILEEKTIKTLLGGRKTDYEAVIDEIRVQESRRAIVKVNESLTKDEEIRSLKQELERSRRKLEYSEKVISSKDSDLFLLARVFRGDLGEKFEDFKAEVEAYFTKTFGKVLELSKIVLMWAGKIIRDNLGNSYSADYEEGRLLINGKMIEQHEVLEQKRTEDKGLERNEVFRHSRGKHKS